MRSMYKMLRDTGLQPGLEFKVTAPAAGNEVNNDRVQDLSKKLVGFAASESYGHSSPSSVLSSLDEGEAPL